MHVTAFRACAVEYTGFRGAGLAVVAVDFFELFAAAAAAVLGTENPKASSSVSSRATYRG